MDNQLKHLSKGDPAFMVIRQNSNAENRAGLCGAEGAYPERFVIPCTVTAVGRKYITVRALGASWERKFYKDGDLEGMEAGDNPDHILYVTQKEALAEVRKRYLVRALSKADFAKLDVESLERIYAVYHHHEKLIEDIRKLCPLCQEE